MCDVNLEKWRVAPDRIGDGKNQQQGMSSMKSGQYEQLITLPGPVKEKSMKVVRKNGTIAVTLPKA